MNHKGKPTHPLENWGFAISSPFPHYHLQALPSDELSGKQYLHYRQEFPRNSALTKQERSYNF
jgi:hypothetical protein